MRISIKRALIVAAATVIVACGGGGGGGGSGETRVAATDTTVAASATTTAAVVNSAFAFPGGVPELGTTGTTTVAFTTTGTIPGFTIDSPGEGTASGTAAFGSCIFRVSTSTFPSTHPLGVGKVVTVEPCTFTINTDNAPANGTPITRSLSFKLGTKVSVTISVTVTISSDGVVTVNNVTVATTPTEPVTGT